MENLNTEQLKDYIIQVSNKLISKLPEEYYFSKNNSGSEEGVYIFSDEKGYHIVHSEKGSETSHKLTDNKFEISFWVIKLIVRTLAIDYMRKNVKPGENQREMILKKELELFGTVGKNYFKVGEVYINEMLKENPL